MQQRYWLQRQVLGTYCLVIMAGSYWPDGSDLAVDAVMFFCWMVSVVQQKICSQICLFGLCSVVSLALCVWIWMYVFFSCLGLINTLFWFDPEKNKRKKILAGEEGSETWYLRLWPKTSTLYLNCTHLDRHFLPIFNGFFVDDSFHDR